MIALQDNTAVCNIKYYNVYVFVCGAAMIQGRD